MNTVKTKKAVIALLSSYVQMKSGNLREGFKILHSELEENTEGVDTVMDGLAQSVESMDDMDEVEEDDYEFIEEEVESGCKSKSKVTSRRRLLAGDDMEDEDEDEEVVDDEGEDEGETVEVSEAVARVLSLEY